MKLNTTILLGIFWLIVSISATYTTSGLFIGLGTFLVVSGIFEIKDYQNKIYISLVAIIISIMLILTFIQLSASSLTGNELINSILAVLMTLAISWGAYDFTKKGKLFKNEKEWVNYVLIGLIIFFAFIGIIPLLQS